jgi:alkylation response protein AidB-like acyl-CoA dehydrogenase
MAFSFTQEQELLRKAARDFAEEHVAPRVESMEETQQVPWDVLKKMAELGFMGVTVPTEYGGTGLGHLARMLSLEELSRVSTAVAMMLQMVHTGVQGILDAGNEEQKKQYVPPIAQGKHLSTLALTETTGGSDPTGIVTQARLEGDNYILNGRKVFITNSHIADVMVAVARTGEGPKGTSAFIVDKNMPGFRPGHEEHKFGMWGANTGEVIFDNCVVPRANLLGNEGDGVRIALKGIGEVGRAGMVGVSIGLLQGALDAAVKFAKERVVGGQPLSKLQSMQYKLADMYMDLDISRLLGYRAAGLKDAGQRCDVEMAMAKYFSVEAAMRGTKVALDIHGGYGCLREYPVQRYYRDAGLLNPSAGTSDIMKIIMARAAMG